MVNGSPHIKGCTYTALEEVGKTLKENGVDYEIFQLGPRPIRDCIGCNRCNGNGCIFKDDNDDVVNRFLAKAKEADGFIFGSPVYFAHPSGQILSFLDRVFYSTSGEEIYPIFTGKPGAAIVSARRGGTTTTLDQLVKYPEFFHMPLVNGSYWAMVHGSNAEQVLQDAEGCAVMQELGRNMAWLLHCIEAGKAAGIDHPQNPPRPMTNFIR